MAILSWLKRMLGQKDYDTAISLAGIRFVVIDTELTGLDEETDDIVSIGAIQMLGGAIEVGRSFQSLVKPRALLDGRTVVIHGITPEQLEAEPLIEEVLGPFLTFADGAVLLGHCLAIDLAFLNRESRRVTGSRLGHPIVDTLSLYGWLRLRQQEHPAFALPIVGLSLFDLARAFEIPVEAAHSAIGDAYVTAQLFQRFLPRLADAGVTDLASLLRVGDPSRQAEYLLKPEGGAHF
jgi:DNA polymerase-3 subunit epsilon